MATIQEGTAFILKNSRPDQEILTIPYDILYAFLSGRRHAVRELKFSEENPIPPFREEEIVRILKKKKVPLIILSNRAYAREKGAGFFGQTHCQRLARYLFYRYQEVKTIGRWEGYEEGRHAIKILQRKG